MAKAKVQDILRIVPQRKILFRGAFHGEDGSRGSIHPRCTLMRAITGAGQALDPAVKAPKIDSNHVNLIWVV